MTTKPTTSDMTKLDYCYLCKKSQAVIRQSQLLKRPIHCDKGDKHLFVVKNGAPGEKYCATCGTKDDLYPNPAKRFHRRDGTVTETYFCCSCQSARRRKYNAKNKSKVAEVYKKQIAKNPEKQLARARVRDAVRRGKIVKPTKCTCCERAVALQGHHPDYSKPLDVIWLCVKCHTAEHRKMRLEA